MADEGTDGNMSIDTEQSRRDSDGSSAAVEPAHTCQQPTLAADEDKDPDEPGSNEKKRARAPTKRTGGPLRGLDMNNVLSPPDAQVTIEISDDETGKKPAGELKHLTRQSRHGRTTANYDMKFHPSIDRVVRPRFAAKRETGTTSLTVTPGPLGDYETDEESPPSSARDGSESENSVSSDEDVPLVRKPDPEASRRSTRTSAQKLVNYSTKHHPQDFGLPGYQHKARALRRQQKHLDREPTGPAKRSQTPIDLETETSDLADVSVEVQQQLGPPRKKLRTLPAERSTSKSKSRPRAKKVAIGKRGASKAQDISSDQESSSDPVDIAEWAIQQSQVPPPTVKPQFTDRKDSAHGHSNAQSSGAGATQTEHAVISTRVVEDSEYDLHDQEDSTILQSTPAAVREPLRKPIRSSSPTGASEETENSDEAASSEAARTPVNSLRCIPGKQENSQSSSGVSGRAARVEYDSLPPSAQSAARATAAAPRTSPRTLSSRTASRRSNDDVSKPNAAPETARHEIRFGHLEPTLQHEDSESEREFGITELRAARPEDEDVEKTESRPPRGGVLVSKKEHSAVPRALSGATKGVPGDGERYMPDEDDLALYRPFQQDLFAVPDEHGCDGPPQLDGHSDSAMFMPSAAHEHASLARSNSAAVGSLLRECD